MSKLAKSNTVNTVGLIQLNFNDISVKQPIASLETKDYKIYDKKIQPFQIFFH